MRSLRSLLVRVVAAAAIGVLTWCTCTRTPGNKREMQRTVCHITDWPVAAAGRLLFPAGHQAIDVYYNRSICDFCTTHELLWRHLRLAVPVYVFLSYVITCMWRLIVRRRVVGAKQAEANRPQ